MNLRALAGALRMMADALEAEPIEAPKRKRGRPKKAPPVVTSSDAAALAQMGVTLGGGRHAGS